MQQTNRKVIISILVVLNLVGGVAWWSVYLSSRSAAHDLDQKYTELAAEAEKESYVTAMTHDLRDTADKREELLKYFVLEGGEAAFLDHVETLATHAGVKDKIFTFDKNGNILSVSLQSEGAFADNVYFEKLLESLPYGVEIASASYTRNESVDNKIDWIARFDLVVRGYLPASAIPK